MVNTLPPITLDGTNKRFAIVTARFNDFITQPLLDGAVQALVNANVPEHNITSVWVPGAFELPQAAKTLAKTGQYDGIICLGCVIRGETPHFDYVCNEAAAGINKVALEENLPVAFGVITTNTVEQAQSRASDADGCVGNKGKDAALTALEMALLNDQIHKSQQAQPAPATASV